MSNLLWALKFKNNDKGREKNIFRKGIEKSCFLGKKKHEMASNVFFCMLSFFVVNFHLQVSEDIWRKVVEKSLTCQRKNLICIRVWNHAMVQKIKNKKVKSEIGMFSSSEFHTTCGILINLVCNTFSEWCRKCEKMMDIDVSWKCSVLFQKGWKCLNSLRKLIYFLVTVSILLFRKQLSRNWT